MSTPEAGPEASESYDVVIGRNIHRLMWDRQLTQTAFGPRIGIAQNTLTRKLRGQRGWSADEIAAAARELRVPVGVLFGLLPDLDSNQEPAGSLSGAGIVIPFPQSAASAGLRIAAAMRMQGIDRAPRAARPVLLARL